MRELESWQRALKLEGSRLANRVDAVDRIAEDPASNVLEWILLVVAVACFAALGWMTDLTYKASPPFPDRFVCAEGMLLMSATGIQAVDDSTVFWQWMRMPGNIVSALGAVLMHGISS